MIELVLPESDAENLRGELLGSDTERCAVIYAHTVVREDGLIRQLAHDVQFPAPTDYLRQGELEAELAPEFVARVTKRARREGCALIFAHSHPGKERPVFSSTDDKGEGRLKEFLDSRHPEHEHAALVISAGGVRARRLGRSEEIRVLSLGAVHHILFDPTSTDASHLHVFDRQVRVFGADGQAAIQRLRVAVVGLGGTGSLIAQQLAHLGVRDFIFIDPDVIDISNLNRVANACALDVDRPKVDVAARYVRSLQPTASISTIRGDVVHAQIARQLIAADLIFGCTDSHGSRAVIQQVAYQYLIPCIDVGVTIAVRDGRISHVFGRVQLLSPTLACFTCDGLLDSNEVRRDMMTPFERQADPYIQGDREPAPAVMSLNGTVSSLAISMMLAVFAGVPIKSRHLLYNAMASALRTARAEPKPDCFVCSRSGALARGNSWPLFARED
jgi:molybdopterin/thiamine biosynthesis adenylyltransferase